MSITTFNSLQEAVDSKICYFCKEKMNLKTNEEYNIYDDYLLFYNNGHEFPISSFPLNKLLNYNADYIYNINVVICWFECLTHNYSSDITIEFNNDLSYFVPKSVEELITLFDNNKKYEIRKFHDLNYINVDFFDHQNMNRAYDLFIKRNKFPMFILPSTTEELLSKIKTYLTFS